MFERIFQALFSYRPVVFQQGDFRFDFATGAFVVAAIAGVLHVLNAGFVSPESLGLFVSTNTLVAALIGGISGSLGPILGGLIFSFAQDEFGARGLTQLLTGIAIVVFIVVFPRGVVGGLSGLSKRLGWRREA